MKSAFSFNHFRCLPNINLLFRPFTSTTYHSELSHNNNITATLLKKRAILQIQGKDAYTFLNGLVTNLVSVKSLQSAYKEKGKMVCLDSCSPTQNGMLYTLMLNPKGRVLYDLLLYPSIKAAPEVPFFLMECDFKAKESVVKLLQRYKLRSKVELKDVSSAYDVWNVCKFDTKASNIIDYATEAGLSEVPSETLAAGLDPRVTSFGIRMILPKQQHYMTRFKEGSEIDYQIHRYLNGVPEGLDEFGEGPLPLECNVDMLKGVDFRKGCYVGQELTIRTYHTGIVRKRLLPVKFYDDPTQLQSDSSSKPLHIISNASYKEKIPSFPCDLYLVNETERTKGKPVGKLMAVTGNIGLALLRLEHLASEKNGFFIRLSQDPLNEGNRLYLKGFKPPWLT